jgi:hypothetical protein
MIGATLLLLALGAPASGAQGAQNCVWLNAGTAARILGTDVTSTVHADSNWSGSCRFVGAAEVAASIQIVVSKKESHACGAGAKVLTGIGNEAVLCSGRDASGRRTQTISARVRDTWFLVVLNASTGSSKTAHALYDASDASSIEFLAEQVAGNLY